MPPDDADATVVDIIHYAAAAADYAIAAAMLLPPQPPLLMMPPCCRWLLPSSPPLRHYFFFFSCFCRYADAIDSPQITPLMMMPPPLMPLLRHCRVFAVDVAIFSPFSLILMLITRCRRRHAAASAAFLRCFLFDVDTLRATLMLRRFSFTILRRFRILMPLILQSIARHITPLPLQLLFRFSYATLMILPQLRHMPLRARYCHAYDMMPIATYDTGVSSPRVYRYFAAITSRHDIFATCHYAAATLMMPRCCHRLLAAAADTITDNIAKMIIAAADASLMSRRQRLLRRRYADELLFDYAFATPSPRRYHAMLIFTPLFFVSSVAAFHAAPCCRFRLHVFRCRCYMDTL